MKMTLKRANWACLLAFVLIFAACKKEKEEEGKEMEKEERRRRSYPSRSSA